MSEGAAYVTVPRRARWWLLTAAVLTAASWVPLEIAGRRTKIWVHQVEDGHCVPPFPPKPDLNVPGWFTAGLASLAALCLIAALAVALIGTGKWWMKVASIVMVAVLLLVLIILLLIGYDDAKNGIDWYTTSGSDGGPLCPFDR